MKKLAAVFRLLLFSGYHTDFNSFVSHPISYLLLHRLPRTPFSVSELAAFSLPDTLAVRPRKLISVPPGCWCFQESGLIRALKVAVRFDVQKKVLVPEDERVMRSIKVMYGYQRGCRYAAPWL